MKRGFYTIMSARSFQLAGRQRTLRGRHWSYCAQKAPEVATRRPGAHVCAVLRGAGPVRRRVCRRAAQGQSHVFIGNAIKVAGCLMMLFWPAPARQPTRWWGWGPLPCLPAKYGILTELLPCVATGRLQRLIEGLTIASIILGVLLGGHRWGNTCLRCC